MTYITTVKQVQTWKANIASIKEEVDNTFDEIERVYRAHKTRPLTEEEAVIMEMLEQAWLDACVVDYKLATLMNWLWNVIDKLYETEE